MQTIEQIRENIEYREENPTCTWEQGDIDCRDLMRHYELMVGRMKLEYERAEGLARELDDLEAKHLELVSTVAANALGGRQ